MTPDFFHITSPFSPAHEHRLQSLVGSTNSRSLSRHQITDWRVPSRSLWHITRGLPAEHRIHHSPPPATGTTTLNPQLVGPWTSSRDHLGTLIPEAPPSALSHLGLGALHIIVALDVHDTGVDVDGDGGVLGGGSLGRERGGARKEVSKMSGDNQARQAWRCPVALRR